MLRNSQEARLQQEEQWMSESEQRPRSGEGRLHFCSERYGMSLEQESDAAEMYAQTCGEADQMMMAQLRLNVCIQTPDWWWLHLKGCA